MRRRGVVLGGLGAAAAGVVRAQDAPPLLFVAGAAKAAVEAVLARWPGPPAPRAAFDTVGALRDRVLAGERPAVVLLSAPAIATLAARGLVAAGSETVIGRTGVGLAAPAGAGPVPDIATPEALRVALLAAPSIAWADPARGATAGRHFAGVLERLGVAEAVRAKARVVPFGVEGVAMAARGEVALAVSQATEILGRPGVAFVGFLPDALQLWTEYRAAVVADGPAARRALAALTTAEARAAFAATGFR